MGRRLDTCLNMRRIAFLICSLFVLISNESLNASDFPANQSQTICDVFYNEGGRYGVVGDRQKEINTQILLKLFKEHNGLIFEEKKRIQTLNLSLSTSNHTVLRNMILENYYTKSVPYTIGVKNGTSYQEISNVTLVCQNKGLCKYGIKYGYNERGYCDGLSIGGVTISNYYFPIVLFSWNTVIGRIDCYKCEYGPVLLGTSLSVGAIYCNSCKNGPILGAMLDEKGNVISTTKNAYLAYSTIDVVSTDGTDVGFCLGVGYAKYVHVETFGIEAKATSMISSFYNTSNTYSIGTIVPEYATEKFYHNYSPDKAPDNLIVDAVFGDNIYPSFEKSDKVNLSVTKGSPYLTKLKNASTSVHILSPSLNAGEVRNNVYFGSELINGGGQDNGSVLRSSNSYGKYVGIVSGNQFIKIKLRGSATPASSNDSINRQVLFLAKLTVGDADQYNVKHVVGETLINLAIDSYKRKKTYTPTTTTKIEGLEIMIDSSEDIPSILVKFPKANQKQSANYIYNLECIGGAYTSVEIVNS